MAGPAEKMASDGGGSPQSLSNRIPSMTGVRAAFSRPTTATEGDKEVSDTIEHVHKDVLITQLVDEADEQYEEEADAEIKNDGRLDEPEAEPIEETEEEKDGPAKSKTPDIFCAEDWDTDLESEEEEEEEDPSFRKLYMNICDKLGVAPASYFVRHIEDECISMRHHGLGETATQALSTALKDILRIKSLDLAGNCICERGCDHLCRMLEVNTILTDLDLSENQLGNVGATYVTKMMLANSSLNTLRLAGNNMDDSVAELFSDCLEESKIRVLDLSRNNFGVQGGVILGGAIGANEYLDEIDLSWNKIRRQGALAVAKGLKENVRLRVCKLAWNGLGAEGGAAVADALLVNNSLKELDISSNRLTMAVATKLTKPLATNDSLEVLKMADNPITTAGSVAIVTVLNNSQTSELIHLDLRGNPVEFEFLKTADELKGKKKIEILHGPILRAGNTPQDIGKPAVDVNARKRKPVLLMNEHLVVNDTRKLKIILKKKDASNEGSILAEDLVESLKELDPTLNEQALKKAVEDIPKNDQGKIIYSGILGR